MPANIRARYEALVATGQIERDRAQDHLVGVFDTLEQRLAEHRLARKSSSLGWLFGARERKGEPLKSVYLHGDVGRGNFTHTMANHRVEGHAPGPRCDGLRSFGH